MNDKRIKDSIIIGFALFAMFFGAGNMIFPPYLGYLSGDAWIQTLAGFVLTGIGVPLLGIVAVARSGGSLDGLADRVSPIFSKILTIAIMICIGPAFAIPRTAATTHELGVVPNFGNVSPWITAIVYFAIVLFFTISPSKVIDRIGTILTPALLVILGFIIVKGLFSPFGPVGASAMETPFLDGVIEGYQTMDGLGAVVFVAIVLSAVVGKGYSDKSDQIKMCIRAGIVAAIGLILVYGGMLIIGTSAPAIYTAPETGVDRAQLLITIVNHLWGKIGSAGLGLAVSLACLTTAIGLTASLGDYFSKLSNEKVSYKMVAVIVSVISALGSVLGISKIMAIAIPVLVIIYPVTMALIVLGLVNADPSRKIFYKGTIYATLIMSVIFVLGAGVINIGGNPLIINIPGLTNGISNFPVLGGDFIWVLAPIVFGAISYFVEKPKNN